ncbi:MAG: phosphatase PAP2 family protein [Jatrophihabitans sp.]|uniref:phosphatase PAP2 family protein n=1 Tax=Jatrophihabitans sp. TaxID=1932789 RepID=UPI003F7D1E2A
MDGTGTGIATPGALWWRDPREAWARAPRSTRWFAGLLIGYVLLTAAVLLKTPVLDVDSWVRHLRLKGKHPGWYPWVHTYVILGQRGPTTLAALPWFLWIAHRRRSVRPLVMLGVALAVLNVSVAVVKYGTGRVDPRQPDASAFAMFQGGNIYPSGHISNCVVLYGLITMLAAPQYRRLLTIVSAFITVTVSAGTIIINTHWVTDVFGGALAGGLVLASLHWTVPPVERWWLRRWSRWRARYDDDAVAAPPRTTGRMEPALPEELAS